jgi:hypothetical protein
MYDIHARWEGEVSLSNLLIFEIRPRCLSFSELLLPECQRLGESEGEVKSVLRMMSSMQPWIVNRFRCRSHLNILSRSGTVRLWNRPGFEVKVSQWYFVAHRTPRPNIWWTLRSSMNFIWSFRPKWISIRRCFVAGRIWPGNGFLGDFAFCILLKWRR